MASKLRRPSLAREITIVLAIKFLALYVIWSVWFAHPEASRLNVQQVGAALYSSNTAVPERSEHDAKP
jgi:hypothetical protein